MTAGLAGCFGLGSGSGSEAGFGLPTLDEGDASTTIAAAAARAEPIAGRLVVERNGCFTWRSTDGDQAADGAWIVWPEGSRQVGDEVVLESGVRVLYGDLIEAVGAVVALDDLPDGGGEDSYFGSFGLFCDAPDRGVVVLTEAAPG